MKGNKRFINYDNAFIPLNEGFFSWIKGLLKNLISGIFHVNSYEDFVKRLNKMPRIILGLEGEGSIDDRQSNETTINSNEVDNTQPNESIYIPKRSRKRLFEARSRYVSNAITEDDKEHNDDSGEDVSKEDNNVDSSNENKDDSSIEHMDKNKYVSEFKPITVDDLKTKTKMPSFKNALIRLLSELNEKTIQLNEKITEEKITSMKKIIEENKTIAMSDIQVIELAVSNFLNLYSSGTLGLPKPEKGKELTISELSQYQNVVSKSDPEKKFASLYNALNKVVDIYEENFNSQWEDIRKKEIEFQQKKADNSSWDGDGTIDYDTIKKIGDNEIEVRGAMDDLIDGCRELIPNAIMGFFISSPIYKAAEEKINSLLEVLVANEKVIEDNKKNPDLKVISLFSDIANNSVKEEDKEKVEEASNLFSEKVNNIVNNELLKGMNFSNSVSFEDTIKKTNVKIVQNETAESLMKKIPDYGCKLAFACLYYVVLKKEIPVNVENNGQNINLFNITNQNTNKQSESFNQKNNLKKIYDYYIWQK